uniref:hypothetical protein n=1 Tax=Candidatus Electronema sp. TaxID=2698783 RepID=UPI0040569219
MNKVLALFAAALFSVAVSNAVFAEDGATATTGVEGTTGATGTTGGAVVPTGDQPAE